MKVVIKGLRVALALLPLAANADTQLSGKAVKIDGAAAAVGVCKSVIADDASRLHQLLRQHRGTLTSSYQYDLNSDAVAGSFTCNEMELMVFAQQIGAEQVSNYLDTGIVTMEELLSSAK